MVKNATHVLTDDPGIEQARTLVEKMKKKGLLIFSNPISGVMLVGCDKSVTPGKTDMDEVYAMHHEIALLFSIQTMERHFQTLAQAGREILALSNKHKMLPNGVGTIKK